jgi:parallel beta-helix repeat protein
MLVCFTIFNHTPMIAKLSTDKYIKTRKISVIFLVLLFSGQLAFGQQIVEVGGVLSENTEWTSNFTYVVTDDVIIPSDITLQINAGVTVRFNLGRGLVAEGGKLFITGTEADSVKLVPNYSGNETWNWKGIVISSITSGESVKIEYALITRALVGIRTNAAHFLSITNNNITGNRNIGVSLFNSSFCEIIENNISENFLGLEIFATDFINQSSYNVISQNRFANHTTNIIVHNSNMGVCRENIISGNLIRTGIHGIWLFKAGHDGAGSVMITHNFIIENGDESDGYGIYVSMDSVYMHHNLFWNNHIAVSFRVANHCSLTNNSIYGNQNAIELRPDATGITLLENTITGNSGDVLVFSEYEEVSFSQNNLFSNQLMEGAVINNTIQDIDVTSCYWGTTDEQAIDLLIYDQNDDPGLGTLVYQPFLTEPDTNAPISPPGDVFAQTINGSVRIFWRSNPETDLMGYRLHSGDFSDYGFSEVTSLITDTVIVLQGVSLDDLFAVTAVDNMFPSGVPQLSGNESPFAFALPIPYAGEDATLCKNEISYELVQSTLPSTFATSEWTTDGDGYFDDPFMVNPSYFFGENDRIEGIVVLTLYGFKGEQTHLDSLVLTLEEPPVAHAGNDAITEPDSSFSPIDASAMHFDMLNWSTTGDGVFNDPQMLMPLYFPGSEDILNQEVLLILTVSNPFCGAVSDTLRLMIRNAYSVEGKVWAGSDGLPENPVIATRLNDLSETGNTFITFTDDQGQFRFDKLFTGTYLFYSPADKTTTTGYLPSYYVNQILWHDGYQLNLSAETGDLDLRLSSIQTHLPVGAGEISGRFLLPDPEHFPVDTYCQQWFGSNGEEFCNGGLSNVTIFLYGDSRRRVYDFSLTDQAGYFSFGGLPFGTYYLEAEIAEYLSMTSEKIILSSENTAVSGIQLLIEPQKKIGIYIPEAQTPATGLHLYPNPAKDRITFFSW